jgi:hypothetical protein
LAARTSSRYAFYGLDVCLSQAQPFDGFDARGEEIGVDDPDRTIEILDIAA